jgi:preprotein translocase subunit SecG
MSSIETYRPQLERVQRTALVCGLVGLALAAIFFFRDKDQFFHSYLFAYVYVVAIPFGSIAILMLHHLTGGWWGYPLRRILEASTRTVWVMAILFIPILLGLSHIYSWTDPNAFPDDELHHFKKVWLSPGNFTIRAVIYFALLLFLVYLLNKRSSAQDQTGDPAQQAKLTGMSGIGVVFWGFIVSAAAFDWVMSLEPDWFSTIFGFIFIDVEVLLALSFTVFIYGKLSDREPLKDLVRPQDYNDIGNLMLAFTMLWAYLQFDQFLLIYATNLRDEIPWYMKRAFGSWGAWAAFLLVFHFFVPFFMLLQRAIKRKLERLSRVAAYMVVLAIFDIYWLITPSLEKSGPHFHLTDFFLLAGIGGLWVAAFSWQLLKLPILPLHDPRFEGVLLHEHGD